MSTVALVGSDTLLGREIRDIVATSEPDITLRLVADIAARGMSPGNRPPAPAVNGF